jgi:hypothetical protein
MCTVLLYCVYCLCVNVYYTAATGCQPNVCCTAATGCQPSVLSCCPRVSTKCVLYCCHRVPTHLVIILLLLLSRNLSRRTEKKWGSPTDRICGARTRILTRDLLIMKQEYCHQHVTRVLTKYYVTTSQCILVFVAPSRLPLATAL